MKDNKLRDPVLIRTSRTADREFLIERINVFLGANGTGKTKLLQELKSNANNYFPNFTAVNIEGGRAVQLYDSLELNAKNFGSFRTAEQILTGFRNNRANTLTSRLFHGLKALEQMGIDAKIEHSDAVVSWQTKGKNGASPKLPDDPMVRVFEIFNDIFPSILLKYYSKNRRLVCRKDKQEYGPTSLSDGEKQVFSILVDIIELTDSDSVLFIDEPELNLNPGLANRLWSSIESLLPNAIFIYATHSVSFAMRDSVEKLIVLSNDNNSIQELSGLEELSHKDQEELLGNIPSLLAQKHTLVVEGHDTSFDSIFYNWIIGDGDFMPTAVGGSGDVIAITNREGKWQKISPSVRLTGIIDSDYKSDTTKEKICSDNMFVLNLHEAESFLCMPEIIVDLCKSLGTSEQDITHDMIRGKIIRFLEKNQISICSKRANEQLTHNIRPSIPSKALSRISSYDDLERTFMSEVENQVKAANETLDRKSVKKVLDNERERITRAIAEKDIYTALKLAPGKELLKCFIPLIGLNDENTIARSARKHLDINRYPALLELRNNLQARILN